MSEERSPLPGPGRDIVERPGPPLGPNRIQYGEAPGVYCPQCHGKGVIEGIDQFTGQIEKKTCWMCAGGGANPYGGG